MYYEGCIKFYHWYFSGDEDKEAVSLTDDRISEVVDEILTSTDTDNDGFITYAEFKAKHYT